MTEYYAVTKFTSNQVLALFTAEEFDAIDASENAEAVSYTHLRAHET